MAKRFSLVMIMVLLFGSISFSQLTATLSTVSTASPGEPVLVPLTIQNFNNIGAITFFISYNSDVLSFTGLTGPLASTAIVGVSGSILSITWSSTTPLTPTSGILCNLNFMYTGPGSSGLTFLTSPPYQSEVATVLMVPQVVAYTNGSVTPKLNNTSTATLVDKTATPGTVVEIPLRFENFEDNIAAITQKISYDPAKLSYIGISTFGSLNGTFANAVDGIITLFWTSTTGSSIDYPDNLILIRFLYTGNTATDVNFSPGCIISNTNASPNNNVAVSYFDATVTPGPITAQAILGSQTGAVQGQAVTVPLNLSGFTDQPAAITAYIAFNSQVLAYTGYSNVTSVTGAQVTVQPNAGGLTILYNNTSVITPNLNGLLLNLDFVYNGPGTGVVTFTDVVFSTYAGSTIPVNTTDATIIPGTPTATATIGFVQANAGETKLVPVTFANLPPIMGAVTLFIEYDNSKLTYIDAPYNPFGAIVNHDPIDPSRINVVWNATTTGVNINSKFLDLRFVYNGGGTGDCGAQVVFAPGCELADYSANLIPATWIDGGINLRFKVSGTLTYDKSTVLPLEGCTILIKDGPEPVPPAVTPVPNVLYSTTTNAAGYFEIYVPNGTYYLYANGVALWSTQWVEPADVTQIRRYIADPTGVLYPNTLTGDALRIRAADINQDGDVDGSDVTPLRYRIANPLVWPITNYNAPDWIFGNPVTGTFEVIVNCSDAVDQSFQGVFSGEVDGSYQP